MVFQSTQLCALQSSEIILSSLLAGFDESNTRTSGSLYLPTKPLTDGCFTVKRHCKCTCLTYVSRHTHRTHTHYQAHFSVYIYRNSTKKNESHCCRPSKFPFLSVFPLKNRLASKVEADFYIPNGKKVTVLNQQVSCKLNGKTSR